MVSDVNLAPNNLGENLQSQEKNNPTAEHKEKAEKKGDGWFIRTVRAIWAAVKWVFKALVGVGLFITNSSFFTVGFIAGIVVSDKVRLALNKVKLVWDKQPWTVTVIVGIGAFLALPITMAASALLFGANLGAELTEYAEKEERKGAHRLPQGPTVMRV